LFFAIVGLSANPVRLPAAVIEVESLFDATMDNNLSEYVRIE
jgi:hypothetical protein